MSVEVQIAGFKLGVDIEAIEEKRKLKLSSKLIL